MSSWQNRRMTAGEYSVIIGQLGLSQLAAGRFLGVSPSTSRRYARGAARIPVAQVLLLRAMLHYRAPLQVPAWCKGES